MTETIVVIAIVGAAVAWAVWRGVQAARGRGSACSSCGSAGSCPYASRGACPSETLDTPEGSGEIDDGEA